LQFPLLASRVQEEGGEGGEGGEGSLLQVAEGLQLPRQLVQARAPPRWARRPPAWRRGAQGGLVWRGQGEAWVPPLGLGLEPLALVH
jgi:hypothetical protein